MHDKFMSRIAGHPSVRGGAAAAGATAAGAAEAVALRAAGAAEKKERHVRVQAEQLQIAGVQKCA